MELLKEDSDYLRHPLMEELVSATSNINEDAAQLMKFHGSYQQDDREQRGAGKVCSSCLWLVLFHVLHKGVSMSGSVTGFFCFCCALTYSQQTCLHSCAGYIYQSGYRQVQPCWFLQTCHGLGCRYTVCRRMTGLLCLQGKAYMFMMRTKQPAGLVSNQLYLTMDDLADQVCCLCRKSTNSLRCEAGGDRVYMSYRLFLYTGFHLVTATWH